MRKKAIGQWLVRLREEIAFVEGARNLDHRVMHATFNLHEARLNDLEKMKERMTQLEERMLDLEEPRG